GIRDATVTGVQTCALPILKVLSAERRGVEIWKHQPVSGVGQRRRIARLVLPGLEVHCLSRADAKQYPQDLWTGDPLSERWVEAEIGRASCRERGWRPYGCG